MKQQSFWSKSKEALGELPFQIMTKMRVRPLLPSTDSINYEVSTIKHDNEPLTVEHIHHTEREEIIPLVNRERESKR